MKGMALCSIYAIFAFPGNDGLCGDPGAISPWLYLVNHRIWSVMHFGGGKNVTIPQCELLRASDQLNGVCRYISCPSCTQFCLIQPIMPVVAGLTLAAFTHDLYISLLLPYADAHAEHVNATFQSS